jgi:AcrR family transcriptional regulator
MARPPSDSGRYHHGDLPDVLRESAADVLAERGAANFSLREVARRAGVSHAAPAHHYRSVEGLLTAVAIEGFDHLRAAMVAAAEASTDPVDRLARQGRAYVEVAIAHPGHCAVLFRDDLVDRDDPAYTHAGLGSFGELVTTIELIRDELNPDLDVGAFARLCWSTMQGLLALYGTMQHIAADTGTSIESIESTAERFSTMLVAGMLPR